MPFFCSKSVEKELIKHNFYDETGLNEMYSTDSQIRFQIWLYLNISQPLQYGYKNLDNF